MPPLFSGAIRCSVLKGEVSSLGFSYLELKNFFLLSLSYSMNLGSKSAVSMALASSLH